MTNLDYIKNVQRRLRGLLINDSPNMEIIRLNMIYDDLFSKLTEQEKVEYYAYKNPKSEEQLKAERVEIARLMNENRDKPSI